MQYTLLFYLNPAEMAARSDPARKDAFWGSFMPYMQSVRDAGIFVTGAGLEPPEARLRDRLGLGRTLPGR